jgi:hypothetical protein
LLEYHSGAFNQQQAGRMASDQMQGLRHMLERPSNLQSRVWYCHNAYVWLNGAEGKVGRLGFAVLANGVEER